MKYEVSNKDLPPAIYTTSSVATLCSRGTRASVLHLKIQKAVECPLNLGTDTQCGRVIDTMACYCANFELMTQSDHKTFCNNSGMKLLSLESSSEEQGILDFWDMEQWTSLTDRLQEGNWIWDTTGAPMTSGYQNWESGEPNDALAGEDCMAFPQSASLRGWNDYNCGLVKIGVCELHP